MIGKGQVIIEFHGKIYNYKELPSPYNNVIDHYVQVGKELYMGPSGDLDDYINHSCDPNSGLRISANKVSLISIRKIYAGEEITWDYSTTMDEDNWVMNCNCGAINCRKVIQDFKYLPKPTQRKYLDLKIVPEYLSRE